MAIATAKIRVSYALFDDPVNAINQVVVHFACPFPISSIKELFTVSGRSSKIHLQHGIATVCQPLHRRIVTLFLSGATYVMNFPSGEICGLVRSGLPKRIWREISGGKSAKDGLALSRKVVAAAKGTIEDQYIFCI